jgi:hypothetical protein
VKYNKLLDLIKSYGLYAAMHDSAQVHMHMTRIEVELRSLEEVAAAQPSQSRVDRAPTAAEVYRAVNRFLSWPLPKGLSPDCGISFDGRKDDALNKNKTWPTGTNFLSAEQATDMFKHAFSVPSAQPPNSGKHGDKFFDNRGLEIAVGDTISLPPEHGVTTAKVVKYYGGGLGLHGMETLLSEMDFTHVRVLDQAVGSLGGRSEDFVPKNAVEAWLQQELVAERAKNAEVPTRHPTVVKWRNDAINVCAKMAEAYPGTNPQLILDMRAMMSKVPEPVEDPSWTKEQIEAAAQSLGMRYPEPLKTGWDPEMGWIIDASNEGEYKAYIQGCDETRDWVERIVGGKRGGVHSDPKTQEIRKRIEELLDHRKMAPEVMILALNERQRQEALGHDADHDDTHQDGEIAAAAACYAAGRVDLMFPYGTSRVKLWPNWMDSVNGKPRNKQLVTAIALLMAEYERMQRMKPKAEPPAT